MIGGTQLKDSWLPVSAVVLGILWMLAGGVAFTITGALIKHLSQTLPITVIVFFRMLVALILLLPWILHDRLNPFATSRPGLHLVRSITGFLSLTCLAYSLSRLDLADATAISFTTPLWMIVTAAVLLGEASDFRRWLATAIAFGYIREYLEHSPLLSGMVANILSSEIELTNGITVACFPSTLRSLRGWSIPVGVLDELGFFRLEGQADADV